MNRIFKIENAKNRKDIELITSQLSLPPAVEISHIPDELTKFNSTNRKFVLNNSKFPSFSILKQFFEVFNKLLKKLSKDVFEITALIQEFVDQLF